MSFIIDDGVKLLLKIEKQKTLAVICFIHDIKYAHAIEMINLDFLIIKTSFSGPFRFVFLNGMFLFKTSSCSERRKNQNCVRFSLNNKYFQIYERRKCLRK